MLELKNICVSFRSERQDKVFGHTRQQVLFDVSLNVKRGTCLGILGESGSGKSTLAGRLGELYQIPVLHLDTVHWLPGWEEKAEEQERSEVRAFMDRNASWVIDGNYRKLEYERRLQEADRIIFMDFNRFSCLFRASRRYLVHKGRARNSMTEGCEEKLDLEFIRWILWDSRTRKQKKLWQAMKETCGEKTVVLKNQRQLDGFLEFLSGQKDPTEFP